MNWRCELGLAALWCWPCLGLLTHLCSVSRHVRGAASGVGWLLAEMEGLIGCTVLSSQHTSPAPSHSDSRFPETATEERLGVQTLLLSPLLLSHWPEQVTRPRSEPGSKESNNMDTGRRSFADYIRYIQSLSRHIYISAQLNCIFSFKNLALKKLVEMIYLKSYYLCSQVLFFF